jgi:nucleotide-binding universal stress UspA family protein
LTFAANQEVIEEIYIKPSKQKLRKLLKRILDRFSNLKNHKFYTLTDYNFFIESVRKQVEEKKIDIIIMGTKGASGLKKLIIGSNTGDVITKVHCTTLVVPENAKFTIPEEIAFPTDFSLSYNIQTLQPVSEISENYNSAIRILHLSKKGSELNPNQQKNKELLEDYFNNHTYSFHFLTNEKIEDAVQCFVESRNIDMIVMAAKNLNYFQRILFLPAVEKISYHTDIPLLVLHEKHSGHE